MYALKVLPTARHPAATRGKDVTQQQEDRMILARRRPVMASSTGALSQTVARPWRRAVPALLAAITLSAGGFVGAAATPASAAVVYR